MLFKKCICHLFEKCTVTAIHNFNRQYGWHNISIVMQSNFHYISVVLLNMNTENIFKFCCFKKGHLFILNDI